MLDVQALQRIVNTVPQRVMTYCRYSKSSNIEDKVTLRRPTSDHDIIIHITSDAVVATWNILNPDSPVSPGFLPIDRVGMYQICLEKDKKIHIDDVANTMVSLLASGVDIIALQEVPDVQSPYYARLIKRLNLAAKRQHIDIDMEIFKASHQPTQRANAHDFHHFATALVMKTNGHLNYLQQKSVFHGRGVQYDFFDSNQQKSWPLINIHGDYIHSLSLSQWMVNQMASEDMLIVGDTNIPISDTASLDYIYQLSGACVTPSTNRNDIDKKYATIDCAVSRIHPKSLLINGNLINYAQDDINSF